MRGTSEAKRRLNLPAPLPWALLQCNAPKDTYRFDIWRWIFSVCPFFSEQSGLFYPWPASSLFKCVCMHIWANLPGVESSFVIVNQSVKAWRALNSGQGGVQRLLYDGWMNWTTGSEMAHTTTLMLHFLCHSWSVFSSGWDAEGYMCYALISCYAWTAFYLFPGCMCAGWRNYRDDIMERWLTAKGLSALLKRDEREDKPISNSQHRSTTLDTHTHTLKSVSDTWVNGI